MRRIVFALLILVLFVFTACGAPGVEEDAQSATEAQVVESGSSTLPVVTVYKTPT